MAEEVWKRLSLAGKYDPAGSDEDKQNRRSIGSKAMLKLRGAMTALVTPMKDNGDVDYDGFRRLVRTQIAGGIDGLVPLGTTGENPTLDEAEEDGIIAIAVEEAAGRVPVIVGTGSNDTRHMVAYTKRAQKMGADAALVVTPYYNKPNDSGLIAHFRAACDVGLPVVIYNVPGRTSRNIPATLVASLASIPGIAGVKEASGDIGQIGDIIRLTKGAGNSGFAVLSGDDALTLHVIALGGDGVISVISNLAPKKTRELTQSCLAGDFDTGRRLHYELLPLVRAAFIETNPVPIKAAMTAAGLPGGPVRLPLGPLSAENAALVREAALKFKE
jgi:4-hydroxy-tetrahydrodipicolinate synthase